MRARVFPNALLVLTKIYIWSLKDASKQRRIRHSYDISPREIVARGGPPAVERIGLGEPLGNNSFSGMTISSPWEFMQSGLPGSGRNLTSWGAQRRRPAFWVLFPQPPEETQMTLLLHCWSSRCRSDTRLISESKCQLIPCGCRSQCKHVYYSGPGGMTACGQLPGLPFTSHVINHVTSPCLSFLI